MLIFLLENKNWETKKLIGKKFFYCEFYSWLQISTVQFTSITSDIYFSLYIIRNTQGTCLEYLAYFCAGT